MVTNYALELFVPPKSHLEPPITALEFSLEASAILRVKRKIVNRA